MDKKLIQQAIASVAPTGNQLATANQQPSANNQQLSTSPLNPPPEHQLQRLRLIQSLPEDTLKNLPQMVLMKETQLMLKHSPSDQIREFIDWVLFFINPKFAPDPQEAQEQMHFAEILLYEFAQDCELTLSEMQHALKMAARNELVIYNEKGNAEKIRLFREIDRLKLEEVAQGYINYRNEHYQYENGQKELKKLLSPPKQEVSDQEINQKNDEAFAEFVAQYKKNKEVPYFSAWVYDYLSRKGQIAPLWQQLKEEEKNQIREEIKKQLAHELATSDRNEYKMYKQALLDYKQALKEPQNPELQKKINKHPILTIRKKVLVKWWLMKNV